MTQTILTGIAIGIFRPVLAAVFNKLTLSVLKGYVCPDVVAVMANVVRHSEQRHDILCKEWCTGGALGNFTDTAEILRSGFHCRVSFHDDPPLSG
ncbi:hypothetical protein BANRA_05507 [Escherichia coli]|uniref:Uncharacterized protein n=1 Tax=Escherichia coli TaxID=562 RepID=A0A3P5HCG5_ECOLX|nr:hypothetical protein BANRA_05507 [Escherichia coli]